MAVRRWRGGASAKAQVNTFVFSGTWEADDLIRAAIGSRTYDFTAGSAVIATILTDLVAAWNALSSSDYPEFAEVTASADATTLTLTGNTAGKPFTCTLTPLEANGAAADFQLIAGVGTATTGTAATACTGPNYWSVAANWLESSVPVTGDDVTVDGGPSIRYGLDQSAVTLASLRVGPNFPSSSEIGLPDQTNPANPAAGYPEYRDRRLKVGATLVAIDTASPRVRLDLAAAATTVTVDATGGPRTSLETALDLVGANAANVLRVNGGSVGLGAVAGDASTFAEVEAADGSLTVGPGVTLTTLNQSGGAVELRCAATTVVKTGGTLTRSGTGAVTTLRNRAGDVLDEGTGAVTTLHNTGRYARGGLVGCTVTTAVLYAGSKTLDPNGTVTWTNPVQLDECHLAGPAGEPGPAPCWVNFGFHRKLAVTDI